MNVLYVYDGEWPRGATRVLKETRALAAKGHKVTLVARNAENAAVIQHEPWMTVMRLPRIPIRAFRYALNFPLFVNPLWLATIWRAARRARAGLILVCDLPLAPSAVWIARLLHVSVQFDMGEVYPEFLRSLRLLERQSLFKRLIRTPVLAEWVERYVLRRVEAVYVVSIESRDRCVKLGVDPDRLIIVGNTPEQPEEFDRVAPCPADVADLIGGGREVLLFVGIIIADRGVLDAIRAMPTLLQRRPKAVLVVVGDGPERPTLESEVAKMGLQESVRLVGWKLPGELTGYYQVAAIGLLPFRDSPHVRLTLANKLFDYMGAGLPVLGSDLPPTRRILTETGAGRMHRPDDPSDFARAAADLLDDPDARARMGANGRAAVRTTYNWELDASRLCSGVERLRGG